MTNETTKTAANRVADRAWLAGEYAQRCLVNDHPTRLTRAERVRFQAIVEVAVFVLQEHPSYLRQS